jgi:anion-transporting  ArsA/GET3 family ATPase
MCAGQDQTAAMRTALDKQLLIVTGKGGAGKTTVAAAAGMLGADAGARTIVVELGAAARVPALFGVRAAQDGAETEIADGLWSISIDPDRALLEWLQALGGRLPGRVLASSGTFQYFAAAAPGAKELVSMIKVAELTRQKRWRRRSGSYDLVIFDAPATGHALGMLRSPQTFGAIARAGPVAAQTRGVQELLADDRLTSYVAVAAPTELAVAETLELSERLSHDLARDLHAVLVNGTIPQRFTPAELDELERAAAHDERVRAAARAARAAHERARFQRGQVARLRRRGLPVHTIPFQFTPDLDLSGVRRIAAHLARTI